MTKHMYRLYLPVSSTVSLSEANEFIMEWAEMNDMWVGDPDDSLLTELNTRRDGSGTTYWRADWRFHALVDKTELQSRLNVRLQNNFSWFVIPYHVCENDEVYRGNCSWDALYYWPDVLTIPDDIEEKAPDPSTVEVIQVDTL